MGPRGIMGEVGAKGNVGFKGQRGHLLVIVVCQDKKVKKDLLVKSVSKVYKVKKENMVTRAAVKLSWEGSVLVLTYK